MRIYFYPEDEHDEFALAHPSMSINEADVRRRTGRRRRISLLRFIGIAVP